MKFRVRNRNIDSTQGINNRGTTLFEVLLYIALFTILSSSTIYLYISILKTVDSYSITLQKIEIGIYMRQLADYQLHTERTIDVEILQNNMQRILKWYPKFRLVDVHVDYVPDEHNLINTAQIIDTRFIDIGSATSSIVQVNSIARLTYKLAEKNRSNIFSNTIYLSLF